MTYSKLILKNLSRKKIRTWLTILSIAVAFVLFGFLDVIGKAFDPGTQYQEAERLVTTHKVSSTQLLPVRYLTRIAQVPGVSEVSHGAWFGGFYQEPKNQFAQFPVDPESYLNVYQSDIILPEAQRKAWLANRIGAIIGRDLAEKFTWEVGDKISLNSMIYPKMDGSRSWEFIIEGIYDGQSEADDTSYMMFHYKYFDEARRIAKGTVGWFSVLVDNPAESERIASDIDKLFFNSTASTKTSGEQAFLSEFNRKFGNVSMMIWIVLGASMFSILLISIHSMAEAVRERTNEIAVLKTLGFSGAKILSLILIEAVVIVSTGAFLGIAITFLVFNGLDIKLDAYLPGVTLSYHTFLKGLVMAVFIGVATGVLPAFKAFKLDVATALRRL